MAPPDESDQLRHGSGRGLLRGHQHFDRFALPLVRLHHGDEDRQGNTVQGAPGRAKVELRILLESPADDLRPTEKGEIDRRADPDGFLVLQ